MSVILNPGGIRELVGLLGADQRRLLATSIDTVAATAGQDGFFYETAHGETGTADEGRIDGLVPQLGLDDVEPAASFTDDDVGLLMSVLEYAATHADDLGMTFTRADGACDETDGNAVRGLAVSIGCPLVGHVPAAADAGALSP